MKMKQGAVCQQCKEVTTGIIYDPYVCANCRIKNLEKQVMELEKLRESQYEKYGALYAEKEKYERWWKDTDEKKGEYLKYKNAFQCLLKEVLR